MTDRPERAPQPAGPDAVRPVEPDAGGSPSRPGPPARDTGALRRLPATLTLCALAVVSVLLARFEEVDPPAPASPTTTSPSLEPSLHLTYTDPERRFRVSVPDGWSLGTDGVSAQNGYPDVFSAATFDIRPSAGACPHMPMQALEDIGAGDAFVWVEQGSASWEASSRPASFGDLVDRGTDEDLEAYTCLSAEGRIDLGALQWFSFADAGLSYWGVVAVGRDASEDRVAEAVAVLDSFDPGFRGQAGPRLWASPNQTPWLLDVRFTEPRPVEPAEAQAVPDWASEIIASIEGSMGGFGESAPGG